MSGDTGLRGISLEPEVLEIDAEGEGTLLGSRCSRCGRYFFPQRPRCGACAEPWTETVRLSREGTLTSFTRVHRKPEFSVVESPYVLAEVTLPEGLKVYSVLMSEQDREFVVGAGVRLRVMHVRETDDGTPVLGYAFTTVASG